MNTKLRARKVW